MSDQLDQEEHNESHLKVILSVELQTVNTTAGNDSLTTVSSINQHTTAKQSVVICNKDVAASNVSTFDLTIEDSKMPAITRFHLKELNLKLKTVLYKLAATLVICFIVGLFALPILFFYIRPSPEINSLPKFMV